MAEANVAPCGRRFAPWSRHVDPSPKNGQRRRPSSRPSPKFFAGLRQENEADEQTRRASSQSGPPSSRPQPRRPSNWGRSIHIDAVPNWRYVELGDKSRILCAVSSKHDRLTQESLQQRPRAGGGCVVFLGIDRHRSSCISDSKGHRGEVCGSTKPIRTAAVPSGRILVFDCFGCCNNRQ
jgi:hypothetical protein